MRSLDLLKVWEFTFGLPPPITLANPRPIDIRYRPVADTQHLNWTVIRSHRRGSEGRYRRFTLVPSKRVYTLPEALLAAHQAVVRSVMAVVRAPRSRHRSGWQVIINTWWRSAAS